VIAGVGIVGGSEETKAGDRRARSRRRRVSRMFTSMRPIMYGGIGGLAILQRVEGRLEWRFISTRSPSDGTRPTFRSGPRRACRNMRSRIAEGEVLLWDARDILPDNRVLSQYRIFVTAQASRDLRGGHTQCCRRCHGHAESRWVCWCVRMRRSPRIIGDCVLRLWWLRR